MADLYIINTCTVTGRADYKSRQLVRRAIRKNPEARILVTGCYAELEPDIFSEMDGVDIVLSLEERKDILKYIGIKKIVPDDGCVSDFWKKTRAFIKIQQGCDQSCAYCRVRLAWGEPQSRTVDEITSEVKELVHSGYKEVVITGVNIGIYGIDTGTDLITLLKKLSDIKELLRIRLTSIEPHELSYELIDYISQNEKIAKHFHIPLQSGSDEILRRMRRRYDRDEYRNIVEYISKKINLCGIGADVIVGFPGETEKDFEETLSLIEELPFTYLHVFTYSPRPGTEAFSMEDSVSPEDKKKRSVILKNIAREKMISFRKSLINTEQKILCERKKNNSLLGFSSNYVYVIVKDIKDNMEYLLNRLIPVKIVEVENTKVFGVQVKSQ
jgi:threonylcarbamoyladenosine tRNA methylthiotransferase MtaB